MTATIDTWTPEHVEKVQNLLASMPYLTEGVGSESAACSIAAINLAVSGTLTDERPACMSQVLHSWIISVQDGMPAEVRDSQEWRDLLPYAPGTGNDHERERLALIQEWMWESMAVAQETADRRGFGDVWRDMLAEKTPEAACKAGDKLVDIQKAARALRRPDDADYAAARALRRAAAADDARFAADAVVRAVAAATALTDADAIGRLDAWRTINPAGLLKKLIEVGDER